MSLVDLITRRFTFGSRFNEPQPLTTSNLNNWLNAQLAAPTADDVSVLQRLAAVQLPITVTATDGTSTTTNRGLTDLFKPSQDLWAILAADTSANKAESQRPANEVAAARWIRAAFSPWQVQEVMTDFWHNHFSVDAYQSMPIAATWPVYDRIIRANALGNFRAMLGATAKSAAMMNYLNLNTSVASHPNENYAREVMELHTLGIGRYLGETTPAALLGTGYSDQDVTNAARVLTGWTLADGNHKAADGTKPNTGDFLFVSANHDTKAKTIFGVAYPAGGAQAEGEAFLDALAQHPGTALTIATKLYVHFVQDTPPANDALITTLATVFRNNVTAPNQIALVLQALVGSAEFAAAADKVKVPFEFLISLIRAAGAEINPRAALTTMLTSLGAPLFHWPTPNGMPDLATTWTGTTGMILRWALADQLVASSGGYLLDGDNTLFAALAPLAISIPYAANAVVAAVLGAGALPTSASALATYAASTEVLGAKGALANATTLNTGLRRLVGAAATVPEFQRR
ncbi:MAG: DUF1800 domain-containing protein [Azospirillaceae bacterium]|nr:DUF1800 domain-containing protein [Azospirillaceae bacterium]